MCQYLFVIDANDCNIMLAAAPCARRAPQGLPTSMLDFDHGARMWRAGYEGGVVEEFDFCPPDAEPGPQRQGRPA